MLILAQEAARTREGLIATAIAFAAILMIVLVGIGTILMLGVAWRRYNQRLQRPDKAATDRIADTDAWQAAADRIEQDPPEPPDDPEDPPTEAPDTPDAHR